MLLLFPFMVALISVPLSTAQVNPLGSDIQKPDIPNHLSSMSDTLRNVSVDSASPSAPALDLSPTTSAHQDGSVSSTALAPDSFNSPSKSSNIPSNLSNALTNLSASFSIHTNNIASLTIPSPNSSNPHPEPAGTSILLPNSAAIPSNFPNITANATLQIANFPVIVAPDIPGGTLVLNGITTTTIRILAPACTFGDEICPPFPFPPGLRYVSYFVSGGDAIVFGDINAGPEKALLSHRVDSDGKLLSKRAHSIISDDPSNTGNQRKGPGGYQWPNGEILYKYESQETKDEKDEILLHSFANWQANLPFLKFTEVSSSPGPSELGVLNVRKGTVIDPEGNKVNVCNCGIGYYPASQNIAMSLTLDSGCDLHAVVHQIGHALGLFHEHQRPDRDLFVSFVCSNLVGYAQFPDPIQSPCHTQDPSICCNPATCFMNACDLATIQGFDSNGDYDLLSLMHAEPTVFAAPGAGDTLIGAGIGNLTRRDSLHMPSQSDCDRVCKIYSEVCTVVGGGSISGPSNLTGGAMPTQMGSGTPLFTNNTAPPLMALPIFPTNVSLQAAPSNLIAQAPFTNSTATLPPTRFTYSPPALSTSFRILVTDTLVIPFEPAPSISHVTVTVQATPTDASSSIETGLLTQVTSNHAASSANWWWPLRAGAWIAVLMQMPG